MMLPAPGGGPGFNVASPLERTAAIDQYSNANAFATRPRERKVNLRFSVSPKLVAPSLGFFFAYALAANSWLAGNAA